MDGGPGRGYGGKLAPGTGHPAAARAILASVSIGATLAEARHRAGLTVAEVSARTRIREGLIRAIEHDEFAACGGDVYARGHIRAIAAAVGTDPAGLIGEYDTAHGYGSGPPTLDDLFRPVPAGRTPEPPGPPGPPGRHRRRNGWLVPVVMLCCLVGIVFVAFQLTGTGGAQHPDAAASSSAAAARPAPASHRPRPRPSPSKTSSPPAPTATLTQLTPVSATAFGPGGAADGDNPQIASLALSGNPATPWYTDWYTTAEFGNLKAGTGLLLDLGRTVTAADVTIHLGSAHGADLQVRAGTNPADLPVVASSAGAGGAMRLSLASHPHARYVLIWFTLLPPDAAGTYQAAISGVTVTAVSY